MAHADWDLVDKAGWVASMLDCVARRALRCHQVGHGAGRAQSSRGCVGVEVGLAGQMCGSQMWVDIGCVRGTIVMEGVWGLSGNSGGDVSLLAPMTPISLGYHLLLGLKENMMEVLSVNFIST